MYLPSLLLLALASVSVSARSNTTIKFDKVPSENWTTTGPNTIGFALTTDGPEGLTYDLYLTVPPGRTYLMVENQTAELGKDVDVTVFPGTAVNATKELPAGEGYKVQLVTHIRNTTADGAHDSDIETYPFNVTDPATAAASPTSDKSAGSPSSAMSSGPIGVLAVALASVALAAGSTLM